MLDKLDPNVLWIEQNGNLVKLVTADGGSTWLATEVGTVKPDVYTIRSPERSSEGLRVVIMAGPQVDTFIWDSDLDAFPLGGSSDVALTDNLISFWELEEASGQRNDSVGVQHLTDINTVTQAVGKVGFCASFASASSERLSRNDSTSLSTGNIDFTFCGWVQLATKPANIMSAIAKYNSSGNNREYKIHWVNTVDRFGFQVSSNGTSGALAEIRANSFGAPSTGVFYFIVVWHDAANNTLNIQINDGVVDSLAHSAGVFDGAAPFNLGAQPSGTPIEFWNGLIDQVGFWKRVLTANERTFLYNNGAGRSFAEVQTGLPGNSGAQYLITRRRRRF